jgi:Skp family chaperone for outer membrane proteins
MVLSPRGILAIGLSLAGIAYFVIPSRIQAQQPQKADGGVRATSTGTGTATNGPPTPIPPVIGTVDLELVMRNYEKVKDQMKELSAAANLRRGELMRLESEYRQEGEMLRKLTPGSADYKKREDRMTELKAKGEAGQEQAQREFTLRQAESLATLYKEIQGMVARVAQWRKINYVLKVSTKPPSGTDPNSVMAAVGEPVIYADPRNDITSDVVHYLNQYYKATKNPAATPKAAARPASSSAGAVQPEQN